MSTPQTEPVPGDIDINGIAEDAMQAAFALIVERLEQTTGMHVWGDVDPMSSHWMDGLFRGFVRMMIENVSDTEEAVPKTLMIATFDVTGLPPEERDALAMEIAVQTEESDSYEEDDRFGPSGHRGVPAPKIVFTNLPEVD